jgi:hypothetical protein
VAGRMVRVDSSPSLSCWNRRDILFQSRLAHSTPRHGDRQPRIRYKRAGDHRVFLRKGMTSEDTLGYGVSGNLSSIVPSVTVNASIPDVNHVPQPWRAKVSSIEAGVGTPGASAAVTYTWTPQQIADFLTKYGLVGLGLLNRMPAPGLVGPVTPAMGPDDELSPHARTLTSGVGTIGVPTTPPIRHLGSRRTDPHGNGMGDWKSTADGYPQLPAVSPQEPGGLLGLLQEYLRNNPAASYR